MEQAISTKPQKRTFTFGVKLNKDELRMLAEVAQHLQRTRGDTVRVLIAAAAQTMETNQEKGQ